MARTTLDRAVTDGRVLPIQAPKIRNVLDAAARRVSTSPSDFLDRRHQEH